MGFSLRPKPKEGKLGEMIETNSSTDGLRLKSGNLRRCGRLQDRGAVQGQSESRWRGIAHRRGGREARLARGGIREHDAFLGYEIWGPAGTGRGGVSMAGGWEGQGARKGAFCLNEKGRWRTSVLCTHIHEFLYVSHLLHFIYFIVISNI